MLHQPMQQLSEYLYDDKIIIDCNYKEGTETITFEEIENSALGSDLTSLGAPPSKHLQDLTVSFFRACYLSG